MQHSSCELQELQQQRSGLMSWFQENRGPFRAEHNSDVPWELCSRCITSGSDMPRCPMQRRWAILHPLTYTWSMSNYRLFLSSLWPCFACLHLLSAETSACRKVPGKGTLIFVAHWSNVVPKEYAFKKWSQLPCGWYNRGKEDNWTAWGLWRHLTAKWMLWVILREMNDLGLWKWENTHTQILYQIQLSKSDFCGYHLACLFDQKLLGLKTL